MNWVRKLSQYWIIPPGLSSSLGFPTIRAFPSLWASPFWHPIHSRQCPSNQKRVHPKRDSEERAADYFHGEWRQRNLLCSRWVWDGRSAITDELISSSKAIRKKPSGSILRKLVAQAWPVLLTTFWRCQQLQCVFRWFRQWIPTPQLTLLPHLY